MAGPISWQLATVTGIRDETRTVRSYSLRVPDWPGHRPGQHLDLRLTAEDGYSVERSYSIASEPERAGEIEITVERIDAARSPRSSTMCSRRATGSSCAGLSAATSCGRRSSAARSCWSPAGRAWCRYGDAPSSGPGGSRVPTRLLFSSRAFEEIIYRGAGSACVGGRRAGGRRDPDPVTAAGLVRVRAADRRAHAGRCPRAARGIRSGVRVRPDRAGRNRGRRARPSRPVRPIAFGPNASARPGRSRRRNRA